MELEEKDSYWIWGQQTDTVGKGYKMRQEPRCKSTHRQGIGHVSLNITPFIIAKIPDHCCSIPGTMNESSWISVWKSFSSMTAKFLAHRNAIESVWLLLVAKFCWILS